VQRRQTTAADLDRRALLRCAGILAASATLPGCTTGDEEGTTPGSTLGSTSEVPIGAGTVFADQEVVVVQPTKGDFRAYSAVCTHQGCLVTEVTGGAISCPCHGSTFDITDGAVIQGPAQEALPGVELAIDGTTLRLA